MQSMVEEKFDVLDQRGGFTGKTATRSECHEQGLWHRAIVVFIISRDGQKILLQKRSKNKKVWPDMWDVAIGGHVEAGEFSYQAALREAEEELGIVLKPQDLICIGSTTSENPEGHGINRHYNDYYIAFLDIDLSSLTLQPEEVEDVKWFDKEELLKLITEKSNRAITDKPACWDYYRRYLESASLGDL